MLPYFIIAVLVLVSAALGAKVVLLRKNAGELAEGVKKRLSDPSNAGLAVTGADKEMSALRDALDEALGELNGARLRYEQGDAALKNALTYLSHDIRTPLTAVTGYLDLLDGATGEERERYLEIIREKTGELAELTDELMQYTTLAAGRGEEKPEALNLRATLESTLAAAYPLFKARGVTPVLFCPAGATVYADKSAVCRVFENVVKNAAKYADGDLTVTADGDGNVRFVNRAQTLTPLQVGKLFDRYYTVAAGDGSMGLGLTSARFLMQRIGGRITAEKDGELLVVECALPSVPAEKSDA